MTGRFDSTQERPRVAVFGLSSCFGCQLQIANANERLSLLLSHVDLAYWQMLSDGSVPDGNLDIAIIEGAVTTEEQEDFLRDIRSRSDVIIAIGACAVSAGIPGLASTCHDVHVDRSFCSVVPEACGHLITPRAISDVVDVDCRICGCPISTDEFIAVLNRVIFGSNATSVTDTLCGTCKRNEDLCFWAQGKQCLGFVTVAGCGAYCIEFGRACKGCRGLSPHANLDAARRIARRYGVDDSIFDSDLGLFTRFEQEEGDC